MPTTTPRAGLPYPIGVDIDNVPSWMSQLALLLDAKMFGSSVGLLSARPTAATGRFYYATDTLLHYISDGLVWRVVQSTPTQPFARYFATQWDSVGPLAPVSVPVAWNLDLSTPNWSGAGGTVITPDAPGVYRVTANLAAGQNGDNSGNVNHVLSILRPTAAGDVSESFAETSAKQNYGGTGGAYVQIKTSALLYLDGTPDRSSFKIAYASSWPGSAAFIAWSILGGVPYKHLSWLDVKMVTAL